MTIHEVKTAFISRLCRSRPFGCAITFTLLSMTGPTIAADEAAIPPKSQRAREIRVTGARVDVPIVMVGEFPFVEGSIAGVAGKFMLDTGSEPALTINDHRVSLEGGRAIGTGYFGSGQTFVVSLMQEVLDIHLGDLIFPRATFVTAQDARQLEAITPDFMGWIGFDAWSDHALKLDYQRSRVTFYVGGPATYLKHERLVAKLAFETRKLPNHPVMPARIGTMAVVTAWDTGQYGTLFTSIAGKKRMLAEKRITPSLAETGAFDLHGLTIGDQVMPVVRAISVETEPFAAAVPIGLTEPDILTIGYGLLQKYKTVWDYRRHRIYLLSRQNAGRARR